MDLHSLVPLMKRATILELESTSLGVAAFPHCLGFAVENYPWRSRKSPFWVRSQNDDVMLFVETASLPILPFLFFLYFSKFQQSFHIVPNPTSTSKPFSPVGVVYCLAVSDFLQVPEDALPQEAAEVPGVSASSFKPSLLIHLPSLLQDTT